jgi:hypothetical protein
MLQVVRVNELQKRGARNLLLAPAEHVLPGRVRAGEEPIRAGDPQQFRADRPGPAMFRGAVEWLPLGQIARRGRRGLD